MDTRDTGKVVVGIAGYHDASTRRGGRAVLIRDNARQVELYGHVRRASVEACESHALMRGVQALKQMQTPLQAIETTIGVKRALVGGRGVDGPVRRNLWDSGRRWWRSECLRAGIRVTRRPGDAYSVALNRAELAAATGCIKTTLTREELDTPGNRLLRESRRQERAQRRAKREHREAQQVADGASEYARVSGAGATYQRQAHPAIHEASMSIEEMEAVMTSIEREAENQVTCSTPLPTGSRQHLNRCAEEELAKYIEELYEDCP